MKKYLVLGTLFSFVWIQMLLFGCTRGMVRTQKEGTAKLRASSLEEVNRHLVKSKSEDGITTYIVLDKRGKMAGIRMVKDPLEKCVKPMGFSDTNSMLRNLKKQKKVGRIRIKKLRRLTSLFPMRETRIFSENKKENAGKRDTELNKGMLEEKDHSSIGIKTGKKIYHSGLEFLAKWVPDFVLKGVKFNNKGDLKYKIPIPNVKQDIEFGLQFNRERNVLSNDTDMIVMGIFTITFGGRRYKRADTLPSNEGPFYRGGIEKHPVQ